MTGRPRSIQRHPHLETRAARRNFGRRARAARSAEVLNDPRHTRSAAPARRTSRPPPAPARARSFNSMMMPIADNARGLAQAAARLISASSAAVRSFTVPSAGHALEQGVVVDDDDRRARGVRRARGRRRRRRARDRRPRSCFQGLSCCRRDARTPADGTRGAPDAPRDSSWDRIGDDIHFEHQDARRSPSRPRRVAGGVSAPVGEERSPRQPHRQAAQRRDAVSRASSATTTRSSRSSSTPSCRGTTSSCSGCAARRKAGYSARWCPARRIVPVVAGCEIHDDPLAPICSACRMRIAAEGDDTTIAWLPREARYVEKLATPDVTIADMIGDIDPIKAARSGLQLSDDSPSTTGCCRAPTAASSASTSCPTWPERFRSACSTSFRKATSRSRAIRFACRSTC